MQVARRYLRVPEWRTAEDHVGTCLLVGDNTAKAVLIPHTLARGKPYGAGRVARGPSGRRWGNGLPSQ
jgi:hypothetical protein